MTTRQHGDTETRLGGFEARLQDGFAWANDHGREIVVGIGAFMLFGVVAAGVYEWRSRSEGQARTELAKIEARYTTAMGANSGEFFVPEPANQDQAKKAREAAIVELDGFSAAHAGSDLAAIAGVRAAELEVDLGSLDAAGKRLDALTSGLSANDPRRAVALRLRGYVFDQSGNALAAGEAYDAAARVESYLARGAVFISAGDAFARANAPERAIAAYREALSLVPEIAEQEGIVARIGIEQARLASPSAAVPSGAAAPAAVPSPAAEPASGSSASAPGSDK